MTFFTGLGIFVAALLGYFVLFGMGVIIVYESDDAAFFGAFFAGIIISIIFTTFICNPEHYGYQKITVSENAVEVQE